MVYLSIRKVADMLTNGLDFGLIVYAKKLKGAKQKRGDCQITAGGQPARVFLRDLIVMTLQDKPMTSASLKAACLGLSGLNPSDVGHRNICDWALVDLQRQKLVKKMRRKDKAGKPFYQAVAA